MTFHSLPEVPSRKDVCDSCQENSCNLGLDSKHPPTVLSLFSPMTTMWIHVVSELGRPQRPSIPPRANTKVRRARDGGHKIWGGLTLRVLCPHFDDLRISASLNVGPTCLTCLSLVQALILPFLLSYTWGPQRKKDVLAIIVFYDGTRIRVQPSWLQVQGSYVLVYHPLGTLIHIKGSEKSWSKENFNST